MSYCNNCGSANSGAALGSPIVEDAWCSFYFKETFPRLWTLAKERYCSLDCLVAHTIEPDEGTDKKTDLRKCSACKKAVSPRAEACPHCGEPKKFWQGEPNPTQSELNSSRLVTKLKNLLLTIIAAVLLVGCGAVIFSFIIGWPPKPPGISIHGAALSGNIEAIKQNLAARPDVNTKDDIGWTPLHFTALKARKEIAELLLANLMNTTDDLGWTPLHKAAWRGHKEIAELLLANGAEVNAKNKRGRIPLHYALTKEISALLLANGAEVNAKDVDDESPLYTAIRFGNGETANFLRKHGGIEYISKIDTMQGSYSADLSSANSADLSSSTVNKRVSIKGLYLGQSKVDAEEVLRKNNIIEQNPLEHDLYETAKGFSISANGNRVLYYNDDNKVVRIALYSNHLRQLYGMQKTMSLKFVKQQFIDNVDGIDDLEYYYDSVDFALLFRLQQIEGVKLESENGFRFYIMKLNATGVFCLTLEEIGKLKF